MITHPHDAAILDKRLGPFVFAALGGFTCSICAPADMPQQEIETFASRHLGPPTMGDRWRAVDKSTIGLGGPTPNPCNIAAGRRHWFLIGSETCVWR